MKRSILFALLIMMSCSSLSERYAPLVLTAENYLTKYENFVNTVDKIVDNFNKAQQLTSKLFGHKFFIKAISNTKEIIADFYNNETGGSTNPVITENKGGSKEVSIQPSTIPVEIEFILVSRYENIVFFELGKYEPSPDGTIESLTSSISSLLDDIIDARIITNFRLDAEYYGNSDGINYGSRVGKYSGEFGNISSSAYVNGKLRPFSIQTNAYISNIDLAYLRARVIREYVYNSIRGNPKFREIIYNEKFVASESTRIGDRYRYGKVILSIYSKKQL